MQPEVSVVMPCLNEEKTIGICIKKALDAFKRDKINGEVVVADNGSTDRSVEIAKSLGARVVHQPLKGYGNAYKKGFEEAKGEYIIMGDSDNTYDFCEIKRFVEPLKQGYDFVIGSRLKGKILKGSMPWLHRYFGNPFLSWFLNKLYHTKISDSHCGMRSFTKDAYKKMNLKTTGMEFASEMVINASKARLKIKEIPITYHPREGEAKLNSLRDGWRHMRFMLLYCPNYLFLIPGAILFIGGVVTTVMVLMGLIYIKSTRLGPITMIFGSLLMILGYQIIALGLYAKTYMMVNKFERPTRFTKLINKLVTLERGIIAGAILMVIGIAVGILIITSWVQQGYGDLTIMQIKIALVAFTFFIIGAQTIFSSFMLSVLRIEKS
jgi:glycosyltransferase involved in cell wall biosynthesis